MKKIGGLSFRDGNIIGIYYDEKAKYNPYRIYSVSYARDIDGKIFKTKKKLIEKYADLSSCTEWLNEFARAHYEEGR